MTKMTEQERRDTYSHVKSHLSSCNAECRLGTAQSMMILNMVIKLEGDEFPDTITPGDPMM